MRGERERQREAPSLVCGRETSSLASIVPPQCSEREEGPLPTISPTVEMC